MIRRGEGPGEYTRIGGFFVLPGDTLVVRSAYDGWPVSVLTPEGEYVRAWPLPDPPVAADPAAPYSTAPHVQALFSDGSALVSYWVRDLSYRDRSEEQPRTPVLLDTRARFLQVGGGGDLLADYGEKVTARADFYHSGDRFISGFCAPTCARSGSARTACSPWCAATWGSGRLPSSRCTSGGGGSSDEARGGWKTAAPHGPTRRPPGRRSVADTYVRRPILRAPMCRPPRDP